MSGYTPQVGDRVQCVGSDRQWDVRAVGHHRFLADMVGGDPDSEFIEIDFPIDANWEKVETPEPIPESWIAVLGHNEIDHSTWATHGHPSRQAAIDHVARVHSGAPILAFVHVWTDEHGTDHAEIERVES